MVATKMEERVIALDERVTLIGRVLIVLVPLLVLWGAYITVNVISMKQALTDQNTKLVTELKEPKSPEQLQAGLSTVIAQVQRARVEGKPPNPQKVEALSKAVSEVVQSDPNLPEAWSAAAELISYRTGATHPAAAHLPPCDLSSAKPESRPGALPNNQPGLIFGFFFSKCSLKLEDVPPLLFTPSELPKDWPIQIHQVLGVYISFPVRLTDGEVIYDGGPIPHGDGFVFTNCVFNIHVNGVPNTYGKSMLTAALKSYDLGPVTVPAEPKPSGGV